MTYRSQQSTLSGMQAFLLLLLLSASQAGAGGLEGSHAPDFRMRDAAGNVIVLSSFRGQVVLLDFWATWCRTCKDQLHGLDELNRKYQGRGVAVLAAAVRSTPSAVAAIVKDKGISLPVLFDDGTAADAYACVHLPTSYLIDRDGMIRSIHKGSDPRLLQVYEQEIESLLTRQ